MMTGLKRLLFVGFAVCVFSPSDALSYKPPVGDLPVVPWEESDESVTGGGSLPDNPRGKSSTSQVKPLADSSGRADSIGSSTTVNFGLLKRIWFEIWKAGRIQ